MKILMIAPEPFFTPRGTPFSEYFRIRCLTQLGHTVDLVTYPIGDDVDIPGLRIFRTASVPGVKSIKIGPSLTKLPLDGLLFALAWKMAGAGDYDLIHTHEEAGIMGVFLSRMYDIPHLYDMHSSLPQQLSTFQYSKNPILKAAFDWMEQLVLGASDGIIAICPSLADTVKEIEPLKRVDLIENTAESHAVDLVNPADVEKLRSKLELGDNRIVLYIGTFETYQGLGLFLESAGIISKTRDDVTFLFVGGRPEQIESVKADAAELGIAEHCRFTGTIPHDDVPPFLKMADVLVSPRRFGTNTPLKIYSYLRSGTPIVATDLYTHTQVLNHDVSVLTAPEPEAFAAGIRKVLENPALGERLASAAMALSESTYSVKRYEAKTKDLMKYLEQYDEH